MMPSTGSSARSQATRSPRRRHAAFVPVALMFLAAALLAPAALPAASETNTLWLRVEISGHGGSGTRMKVNVPLSLVEVVVESMDGASFLQNLHAVDAGEGHIDIRKMWQSIRDMNLDEFVTIEGDDETVKVYKDRDFFRVDVHSSEDSEEVELKIPLGLMDYLFQEDRARFDFQEMVSTLRGFAPLQIVKVEGPGESVSVWIEER